MSTPTPERIGPYEVIRPLGRGGMGEVFLAYDPRLDRRVAIKRIHLDGPSDPSRRARLRREARLAASLQHPAIVQVFDLVTEGDTDSVVFEYVAGDSLHHALAERGPLPLGESLAIARRVAEGLVHAHRCGVVHRDLKAENVLLTPEGEAKITDFGIARRLAGEVPQESLTREGVVLGTYRAMAPEQVRGLAADHRSDLFSFGVLLYELCTARSPFLGGTGLATAGRILHHRQAPAADLVPELPESLSALIDRLLEKEPVLRPQDAAEVADTLGSIAAEVAEKLDVTLPAAPPGRSSFRASPAAPEPACEVTMAEPSASALRGPEGEPRRRGRRAVAATALVAALVTAAVLATVLAVRLARDDSIAPPPLYVAVLAPEMSSAAGAGSADETAEPDRLLTFAVRNALHRTLASLEGVFPKTAGEVDAISGPPTAVARAVVTDEVITSSLACETASCWVEISRVRGGDASVPWTEQVPVDRSRPLAAARAVGLRLRDAYPGRPLRAGVPELSVSAGDYAAYLELERALDAGLGQRTAEEVLEGLAAVRRGSPGFLDAYLLAASLEVGQFEAARDDPARLSRALELMRRAEELAPGDPEVLLQRVDVELHAEHLEEAEAALVELRRRLPGHVALLDLSADLARRRGRPAEALALSR